MTKSPSKPAANKAKLAIVGVILVVLAGAVLWLNFGRGGTGASDEAAEAARRAAAEVGANQPEPDPNVPPVPSPARPDPMGR